MWNVTDDSQTKMENSGLYHDKFVVVVINVQFPLKMSGIK